MPRPSSYVLIKCAKLGDKGTVHCLMGEEVPRITGGYGGWNVADRPRKRASIEYEGLPPLQMQLEVVLDAWGWDIPRDSVNDDLEALEKMASPLASGGRNAPPPSVTIEGKAIPRDKTVPWVIEDIEWGSTIVGTEGQVLRQTAQLTLLQADVMEHERKLGPTRIRTPRPPGSQPTSKFHWKKGDTWMKVAKRLMGSAKHATVLARHNGFRRPKKPKVGYKVKVPRVDT